MTIQACGTIDVIAYEHGKLPADGNKCRLPARLCNTRNVLPLAFAFINIDHVDAQVQGTSQEPVAASLAFFGQHGSMRHLAFISGIRVRSEREKRGIEIGLPKTAIDHAS